MKTLLINKLPRNHETYQPKNPRKGVEAANKMPFKKPNKT